MSQSTKFAAAMSPGEYSYNMLIKRFASVPEPSFESAVEQEGNWGRVWGCNSDVGQIRLVLMHRPGTEMNVIDRTKYIPEIRAYGDDQQGWYWAGKDIPDFDVYRAQHDALAAALREEGAEVIYTDSVAPGRMKSVYTRDSVIAVNGGAIVTRLGPKVRRGEEAHVTKTLAKLGMPILRTIHGTGIMEGGSFAFLKPNLVAIGISSRVNVEGVRQVAEVLAVHGVSVVTYQVPGYRLHLDGAMVMVNIDTALINPARIPFQFLEQLEAHGIRTVEVSERDPAFGVNCLAVKPGRIFVSHPLCDETLEALRRAEVSVRHVPYDVVCLGGGGVHCSTAPLIREPI